MQAIGAWLVGMIENQGGTDFADCGGAVAFGSRHFEYRLLVQVVSAEMLVDIDNHRVDFEERRHRAVRMRDRITGIDRVREVAGIAEAFAVVKVGNSECEFLKLTPLSRTSAMAGAVCGVTICPRNPSGTNRIRLWGVLFWPNAVPAHRTVRPTDSNRLERRIEISPR